MKASITNAVIAGLFTLCSAYFAYYLNKKTEGKVDRINNSLQQPSVKLYSPKHNSDVGDKVNTILGHATGPNLQDLVVLIGHRGMNESNIKIHADRVAEISNDGSFKTTDIFLGNSVLGRGESFEIIALLSARRTIDELKLGNRDNPLRVIPEHMSKDVIYVTRR